MSEELYREIIMDHSQRPRRHGHLTDPTHQGHGDNPLCGDKIKLDMQIDNSGVIQDVAINVVGCAISTASASLMAHKLLGLNLEQAGSLFDQVHDLLVHPEREGELEELGEVAALQMVRRYPMRVKCATLCWHVLKHALDDSNGAATTE
jgi:nitrogen fixation NifU-like protein